MKPQVFFSPSAWKANSTAQHSWIDLTCVYSFWIQDMPFQQQHLMQTSLAVWFLAHPSSFLERRENHLLEKRDRWTMRHDRDDISIYHSLVMPDWTEHSTFSALLFNQFEVTTSLPLLNSILINMKHPETASDTILPKGDGALQSSMVEAYLCTILTITFQIHEPSLCFKKEHAIFSIQGSAGNTKAQTIKKIWTWQPLGKHALSCCSHAQWLETTEK